MKIIHKKQYGLTGGSLCLIFLFSGCATLPSEQSTNNQKLSPQTNATHTSINAIKTLEIDIIRSAAEPLALFAPSHYAMVNKTLNEAQSLIKQQAEKSLISQKMTIAKTMIRSGKKVKKKVRTLLEKQFSIKKRLDSLNSNESYRPEYSSMIHRLKNIIQEIEENNILPSKKTHERLLSDMRALELRSIQHQALHEPGEIIQRIKYQNGEKLAPTTYQDAIAVYRRAERFIQDNPENKSGTIRVGKEALFAAKRALYITNQVSALIQKVDFSLEQVILDEEYRLYRVSRELDSPDLRDNPLEIQSEKLALLIKQRALAQTKQIYLISNLNKSLSQAKNDIAKLEVSKKSDIKVKIATGKAHVERILLKKKVKSLTQNLQLTQAKYEASQQKLSIISQEYFLLSQAPVNGQYRPLIQRPEYTPPLLITRPRKNNTFNEVFVDAGD